MANNEYFKRLFLEKIPLDKYNLYILSLHKSKEDNVLSREKEFSIIFNFFNNLNYHIIISNENINEFDDILRYDFISKLIENDILVIVFNYWKRFKKLL